MLIVMSEPTERRSNRSRKPTVHFDNQIAQLKPSEPSIARNASAKPPSKSTKKPTPVAKSTAKPTKPTTSTKPSATKATNLDLVEELCSQTEGLEITNEKAKKQEK